MDELNKLLVEQLRDIHSAEKQQSRFAPKALRKITSPRLRAAMQAHAEESEGQIERLEQALERLGGKVGRKVCEGMRGLIEEAQEELEDHDKGPLLDCVMIAALQRLEHYEIAAYGSVVGMARAARETELAEAMEATLVEEKRADQTLSEVAEQEVNGAAVASVRGEMTPDGDEDEEDEEGDEEEAEAAPTPKRTAKSPVKKPAAKPKAAR